MANINVSYTVVDNKIWEIQMWLVQHERWTLDTAQRFMAPLRWYVSAGRASVEFLRALVTAKTFVVGRVLVKQNSAFADYSETVAALRRKFNID